MRRADGSINQVLQLDEVYVNSEATLYRGALDESFELRPSTPTFILSDVNGDGEDDSIIWTGNKGNYGGPSFNVYLFDKRARKMEFSAEISALTVGRSGLFTTEKGKIKVSSSDGCCLHVFDTYELETNRPKLIERVIENTSGPEPMVTTERLKGDELRRVSQERLY